MNKTLFTTILVASATLFFSCDTQEKEAKPEEVQVEKAEKPHHEADGHLSLNEGKKWIANSETTTGVNNLIVLMDGFSEPESVEGYKELTKTIKAEFSNIFKLCTMTGPAHDQLHNFLIPIKNSFKGLSSDDLETCKTTFGTLRSHLDEYDKYFETEVN